MSAPVKPFSHRSVTCPTGWLPATRYVEFYPGEGLEHQRWRLLACNAGTCLDRQLARAERSGVVVDVFPLTREVAEEETGLDLSEQVAS